ncbi:DEAD/DEAH box helicase [Parapedomonas caeni]
MSFEFLGLSEELLRAVADSGYTEPTPIQRQAIPTVLQGRDVLGIAQTGTGKTASFTLPMIDILAQGRARARMPRSLILEPTRELAVQVAENFEKYGKYHKLSMALLIGGMAFGEQDRALDKGVDVLIATPGRLIDQCERSKVMLSGVEILVIDEADRMLDMGFIPDVERIVSLMPPRRQTLFFSATMPPVVKRLADQFLRDPKAIEVARPATANTSIAQSLVVVGERAKRETLRDLIRELDVTNAIIFCNRKRDVKVLQESLTRHGFKAGQLHGDMEQAERLQVLERFRAGDLPLLVASDVAARGLDVPGVSHVFNFDVPIHADDYVHRIGRTGRAGRSGVAVTLATPAEAEAVAAVEALTGQPIPRREVAQSVALEAPEAGRRGGDRRRSRGKGGADKSADKALEKAAEKPAREKTAEKPAGASESRGRRDGRPERESRPERERESRPERERDSRPAREARHSSAGDRGRGRRGDDRRDRDDADEPVVGLGAHVPAFLLVSARGKEAA